MPSLDLLHRSPLLGYAQWLSCSSVFTTGLHSTLVTTDLSSAHRHFSHHAAWLTWGARKGAVGRCRLFFVFPLTYFMYMNSRVQFSSAQTPSSVSRPGENLWPSNWIRAIAVLQARRIDIVVDAAVILWMHCNWMGQFACWLAWQGTISPPRPDLRRSIIG